MYSKFPIRINDDTDNNKLFDVLFHAAINNQINFNNDY